MLINPDPRAHRQEAWETEASLGYDYIAIPYLRLTYRQTDTLSPDLKRTTNPGFPLLL